MKKGRVVSKSLIFNSFKRDNCYPIFHGIHDQSRLDLVGSACKLSSMIRWIVCSLLLGTGALGTLPAGRCVLDLLHLDCACSAKVEIQKEQVGCTCCADRAPCSEDTRLLGNPQDHPCLLHPNPCCPILGESRFQFQAAKPLGHPGRDAPQVTWERSLIESASSAIVNRGVLNRTTGSPHGSSSSDPPLYLQFHRILT